MLAFESITIGIAALFVTVVIGLVLTRGKRAADHGAPPFELRCRQCGCVEAVENARVIRDPSCSDGQFRCSTCARSPGRC